MSDIRLCIQIQFSIVYFVQIPYHILMFVMDKNIPTFLIKMLYKNESITEEGLEEVTD